MRSGCPEAGWQVGRLLAIKRSSAFSICVSLLVLQVREWELRGRIRPDVFFTFGFHCFYRRGRRAQVELPRQSSVGVAGTNQDDAMSKKLALLAACLLWATLAPAQTRVSTQDFVTKVAISDMMEIQSSELALARQPDADTKPFAEKMVKDHQQTSRELKALVDSGKVKASLPSALGAEHQKKLEDLKAKSGKDFDRSLRPDAGPGARRGRCSL